MPHTLDYYEARLRGERVEAHLDQPQPGVYANKSERDGRYHTAYYLPDPDDPTGERLLCVQDHTKYMSEEAALRLWRYMAAHPISAVEYEYFIANGHMPCEHPAAAADRELVAQGPVLAVDNTAIEQAQSAPVADEALPAPVAEEALPGIGHNKADPLEVLMDRWRTLKPFADDLIKKGAASSQHEADQAQDLMDRINGISKEAKPLYAAEKKPHQEEVEKVQNKWRLLAMGAAGTSSTVPELLAKKIKAAIIDPFLKTDTKRMAEERQAQIAQGADPDTLPQQRASAGSGHGRSVTLHTHRNVKVKGVNDALAHAAEHHPDEVMAFLHKLYGPYARGNVQPVPPGIEYEEITAAA